MLRCVMFLINQWKYRVIFFAEYLVYVCIVKKCLFSCTLCSVLIALHILIVGSMVHVQCVLCGRKINAKYERREVNIPRQLFVAAQKTEQVAADSFLCTGERQNEYYERKRLIQSLQYKYIHRRLIRK